jgi:hypothetical protein
MERRILRELWDSIQIWSESVRAMSRWEDEHLLDCPAPELQEQHRRMVGQHLALGKFITLAAEHPEFSDQAARERIAAAMSILRDKIPLWHGTMEVTRAEKILAEAFPES